MAILELAKLGDMTITYGVPAIVPITIDNKESYIKILADKENGKIYTYLCNNEDEPIPFFQAAMYIANNFVDFKLKKQEIYRNIKTGRTAFFSSQENSKILSESKLNSDGSFKRVDLDKNLGQKEVLEKKESIERIISFCETSTVKANDINAALERWGTTPLNGSVKLADLIARPQLNVQGLAEVLPELMAVIEQTPNRKEEIVEAAEIKMKYKGYIEREKIVADKMRRLENIRIKGHFNYEELHEISTEGRQKLARINPETLAQASRIPGVSPSDINVLLVLMNR